MNRYEYDILLKIADYNVVDSRQLAKLCSCSLSTINKSLNTLREIGYIDDKLHLLSIAEDLFFDRQPKRAIILAAGFGLRMVPINTEISKALLEIDGERLIERLIKQLHKVGIYEIYIVVGYMKDEFNYLVQKYGVHLIFNEYYSNKNNLFSLYKACEYLDNAYIVPCDIWCSINPFKKQELYSWYMISDLIDNDSNVRINRKMELVKTSNNNGGNSMVGIAYLTRDIAIIVKDRIKKLVNDKQYDNSFWEEALFDDNKMSVFANVTHSADVVEINTYEQLREIDAESNQLKTDAITVIQKVLNVKSEEIVSIKALKKGMTNRSFLFECNNKRYIMRIPGEGTDKLINRAHEADVYKVITGKGICESLLYIDPLNGYKISEYLNRARECNPDNEEDLRRCMEKLREFHEMALKVDHSFDIVGQIEFYESLWDGKQSVHNDYNATKQNALKLLSYINRQDNAKVLAHIDAVPDNFLFVKNKDNTESIYLIDWEYAGMQDPHVDIAMFCIYASFNKDQIDKLINYYFRGESSDSIRLKIYCYIALCGLLWSNWCEYKSQLGVEFGEYADKQYQYAKDFYTIVIDELKRRGETLV